MSKLLTLPAGRRSKWVVLAVWFAALFAIVALGLPTKYTEAEQNESTSFLPGDAESTAVLEVTKRLQGAETAPTVVVYQRDDGLTPADRATIGQELEDLNAATGQFANTTPFLGPKVSPDGTTALVTNVLRATGESDDILEPARTTGRWSRAARGCRRRSAGRRAPAPTRSRSSPPSTGRC